MTLSNSPGPELVNLHLVIKQVKYIFFIFSSKVNTFLSTISLLFLSLFLLPFSAAPRLSVVCCKLRQRARACQS